ncbi:2OG-Fe(II) oxygenase [Alteromonas sp. ASW11-130]|uniref:2OG-Fe(II) oxygenase n=1 Tax=Alteromonas sp. ASW11-130 TaxID=3015775 RepID=UPI00224248BE|nr:2OG-Fe(II) oxygenase [Alteromonas sp. ASW11-130]MCW8092845.1 2OG-Fe(II) oxygenase [Alteromonas sp. ASW11-130]
MAHVLSDFPSLTAPSDNLLLFEQVAKDIETQGFSIRPGALPPHIADALLHQQLRLNNAKYQGAGIGRGDARINNSFVRTDAICWITGSTDAGRLWLEWANELKNYLNQRLFLGLFSFESHFALYPPGAFYKRHLDSFKGNTNRIISLVTYLNSNWSNTDGGELVLYQDNTDQEGIRVVPLMGTLAIFLSEEFPHEVLPAHRDRYSVAGWFRVNASVADRVDPPR